MSIAVGADDREDFLVRRTDLQAGMQVVKSELFNAPERPSNDFRAAGKFRQSDALTGM